MKTLKKVTKKKLILAISIVLLIVIVWMTTVNIVAAKDRGQFTDSVFEGVPTPTNDRIISAFTDGDICWEMAYWSAMMAEFTYSRELYPSYNFAMETLGFSAVRVHTYFEHNDEYRSNLMLDAGVKTIYGDDGSFTLLAIAFRGTVPPTVDSRAARINMQHNIDIFSQLWGETGARVHRGFYEQHNNILSNIFPVLSEVFDIDLLNTVDADMKIWLSGHSMGGTFAELFTLDLIERGMCPQMILAYSIAAPFVGCRQLRDHANETGAARRIFRIAHRRDLVAHVGFGLMWGHSLAHEDNIISFGEWGLLNSRRHLLTRTYLPFIIEQNESNLREQMQNAFYVTNLR